MLFAEGMPPKKLIGHTRSESIEEIQEILCHIKLYLRTTLLIIQSICIKFKLLFYYLQLNCIILMILSTREDHNELLQKKRKPYVCD